MTVTAHQPAADSGAASDDILFNQSHDNAVRARPGERFEHLFEERVDILAATDPGHLAIDSAELKLTFSELDARANQLARFLKVRGFGSGDRFALLFDKSIFSYIATLAVLKINAAYVPLDQSFPADRIAFICEDAECKAILTIGRYREHLEPTGKPVLHLDEDQAAIDAQPAGRLSAEEKGEPKEELAYVIYTSGSTGKPKGVPIDHAQIVNFVRVAAEVYGIRPDDRMYQGLTIAFDFAIEEIWVPLAVGATLVPGPTGARLLGKDLGDYLEEKKITALCCVPTLLATLEAELPLLRYIMVSGEACPQDLVARWQKPGRIFLNAYGPTEATVTATLTALEAGKPVTIGVPLPTYAILMLDPDAPRVLKRGETGEIAIAGIAIARGYLNREDQTKKAFIPDFLGIPGNESGRIYRTGDLGRINADGEIEYMGRIDTQVKIRGYRIELTEIESVLMKFPGIAQAVVNKHEATPGAVELAAYYTLKPGITGFGLDAMVEELRQHVPAYMVPAYFEQLDAMPLLPSHKADRKKLPPPSGPRYSVRRGALVAPEGQLETSMAEALAATLKLDEVSVEDHFFDDMGANSLLMAQFCTRLRETGLVGDVSMRDTYQHPTIRALAAHLEAQDPAASIEVEEQITPHHASLFAYVMTGVAQAAVSFAYMTFTLWLSIKLIVFTISGSDALDFYVRSVTAAFALAAALTIVPIALKWLLIGRWRPERFPIWGLKYFRFWFVRTLLGLSPMQLFAGTPFYNWYLRLLGAKIGKDVVLLNGGTLVATDMMTIGDGAWSAAPPSSPATEHARAGSSSAPSRSALAPISVRPRMSASTPRLATTLNSATLRRFTPASRYPPASAITVRLPWRPKPTTIASSSCQSASCGVSSTTSCRL
jgi:amino acid adenylation domain-containing protein